MDPFKSSPGSNTNQGKWGKANRHSTTLTTLTTSGGQLNSHFPSFILTFTLQQQSRLNIIYSPPAVKPFHLSPVAGSGIYPKLKCSYFINTRDLNEVHNLSTYFSFRSQLRLVCPRVNIWYFPHECHLKYIVASPEKACWKPLSSNMAKKGITLI